MAGTPGREAPDLRPARRGYLDWLRGVAVLIMIEAHLLDSWTRVPDRESTVFAWAVTIGGLGAPLFLFLAGVAVALSAAAKFRRLGSRRRASAAVVRRGAEIFGLAFLFRLQAWILGWSSPWLLLRVDILNIMGPSIAAAGALWGALRSTGSRLAAFLAVTTGLALLTPVIWAAPVESLPDPIEAYIRPVGNLSNFVFFPWAAFVFAGAVPGLLLESRAESRESRLNRWLFAGGAIVAVVSFAASYLPSPYPRSNFWTTSPCFFFLRAGLMTAAIGVAYAWESRRRGRQAWSPLRQLGRTSLFIYWIHVEMLYGLISRPIHKSLTLGQALAVYVLFALFMLVCSMAKDRLVLRWRARRPVTAPAVQLPDRPEPRAD